MNNSANCAIWSVSLYDQLELMFGTLLGQVEQMVEIGHCGRCGGCKYLAGDTYGYLHGTWLDLQDSYVTAICLVVQGGLYIYCFWWFE